MTRDTDNARMTRQHIFADLASRGADRAVLRFSGGNDEGGPDTITLYKGEDRVGALSPSAYAGVDSTASQKAEAALVAWLSQPIYDQYGGFDGDFDVYGELIWDVTERTVQIVGEERSEYSHFEELV
jgi:hypothetical protein